MKRGERRIVLSYARPDQPDVERLYNELRAAGLRPWMDIRDIGLGEDWRAAIERAIRHCDAFLAIVSSNSVGREGILQSEMKEALDLWDERLDRTSFLIPVRLNDHPIPDRLQHLHWVDLFTPGGKDRLIASVSERIGRARRRFVRRIASIAAVLVVVGSAMVTAWWFGRSQPVQAEFASYRPGGVNAGEDDAPPMIGVTLWRAVTREVPLNGTDPCGDVEFVRERAESALRPGSELRLAVEVNRRGYVYVLNSEGGSPYHLVHPTEGVLSVGPGMLVQIPPHNPGKCTTILVKQSGGASESVVVVFSDKPMADTSWQHGGLPEGSLPNAISRSGEWVGGPRSAGEEDAAGTGRSLVVHDRTPQTVFRYAPGSRLPLLAQLTLEVSKP